MVRTINLSRKRYKLVALCLCLLCAAGAYAGFQNDTINVFAQNKEKRKLPIYCVDTQEKKLSISFDAAWGADDTDELLRILNDNDVKATFFLCGYWVDKYSDEVKKIYNEGHDIANHSDTHPHGNQLSLEQNKANIQAAHDKVKDLLGIDMNLYRPPFGEYNNTVLQAAEELGYYTIQWDVDTLDTKIEVSEIHCFRFNFEIFATKSA